MAAKKNHSRTRKSTSKKKPRKSKASSTKAKKWNAPKNVFLGLFTLPFRLIYNLTRHQKFYFRWPLRAALLALFSLAFCCFLFCLIYIPRAYLIYEIDHVSKMPARTLVYASDGETELGRLHGDNRYVVQYDEVSPYFVNALLAQEDEHFRDHCGVDFWGLLKIPVYYLKYKKVSGASTISMQLARNSFPLGEGPDRKLLEIAVAFRIEQNFDKDQILEHYMNRIFFGHSMHGVEAASRAYFEKSAKDINLSEAAMLAGIIRGPNLFTPFKNIDRATRERDRALDRMVSSGFITEALATQTKAEKLHITPPHRRVIKDTYVMDVIHKDLAKILETKNLKMGNLKVYTTIDHKLQNAAQLHLESHLRSIEAKPGYAHQTRSQWNIQAEQARKDPRYLQAALVCVENRTGEIKTLIGGRNAKESSLNRATDDPYKRKQIGSIVKPFVYLSAFDQGLSNSIQDTPINGWPSNFDGKYYRNVSVNKAIAESRNCAAVHAGIYATKEHVSETLRVAGYRHYDVDDSSFFLGTGCATPLEVASAFTIFPNRGERFRPFIIREIRDQNGNLVYESGLIPYKAANKASTQKVCTALEQVTKSGTAKALQGRLNFRDPCGGKTGTSNETKDAWFTGYTESLSCAVWVGLDTPKSIVKDGSGSTLALPIWAKIMNSAKNLGYPMYPRAVPVR